MGTKYLLSVLVATHLFVGVAIPVNSTPEVEGCGRVPVFEKIFHRSANSTHMKMDAGDFRILHGLDAMPGEWPWIVKLRECDNDNCAACTGTLLNSRWIITAGHCAYKRATVDKYTGILGLYDLLVRDATATIVKFDKLVVHPNYTEMTNDVALFRLSEEIEYNDFVQPACLVDATRDIVSLTSNFSCSAVGYGLIEDMSYAIKLQKLEIKARPANECNGDQMNNLKLRNNTVCIGPMDDKIGGSCKGDSGGPNLCYNHHANRWFIFGTVSYGPAICDRESDDKWLTVSVDLSRHRDWILSVISDKSGDEDKITATNSVSTTTTSMSTTTTTSTNTTTTTMAQPETTTTTSSVSTTTTTPPTTTTTTKKPKRRRRKKKTKKNLRIVVDGDVSWISKSEAKRPDMRTAVE